jgi:hypothetical protein
MANGLCFNQINVCDDVLLFGNVKMEQQDGQSDLLAQSKL